MSILDRPLPPEDLPTTRHAQLSHHVTRAIKDAMILPSQTEGYDPAVSPETPVEDFNSHTYEDILATAILNKVLESCDGRQPEEVTIEVSHDVTSTDTDSGMSGGAKESRRGRHKRSEVSEAGSEGSEERSLTPPLHSDCRPPTVSPDQGVVSDDCWAGAVSDGLPLQFKIEEHVEEITTHHLTDDDQDLKGNYEEDISDSGGSWRGSRCSLDDSRGTRHHKKVTHHSVTEEPLLSTINVALPDPAHITSRRVSFPELGANILHDSCSDTECCEMGPGDMVVDSDTWEENWLFRRHRLVGATATDPVTMLIPNPEAHVPPTVGNRDVDELSELSEQHSFCSGEPWSTSESEGEGEVGDSFQPYSASRELSTLAGEIVAEFAQQDQEYTVDYSVPSRVTAKCTTQQSIGRNQLYSSLASKATEPQKSSATQMWTHHLDKNYVEVPRGYHDGKTVEGIRNLGISKKPQTDPDFISDSERPVPKPRKLSLAMMPPSKTSFKSPMQIHPSLAEDPSILSPPLDVPHPKNASSKSETVWFVETPEDSTVMHGRTLRLSCEVNTKKPMGLSWYQNGSLVPVGIHENWAWRQGSTHHLHVYGITSAAAGEYAAAAYTATHCVWAFCRVQHKASSRPQKRPTFTKGLSDITLEEGAELNVQCQVQGHPEPRVIFSRGTERLEPSSRAAIESDQYGTWTLRLADCRVADSGEVTATATNMMSTITTRCKVKVVPEGTPVPQQDHTSSGRVQLSDSQSNKQHNPRPGSRHKKKIHELGSHPSSTIRSSSESLLTSAKILAPSPRDHSTASAGVNTDANDLDDIHQIPTRPGTIAEREHRKWEAAVPLPNNPYAPERLVHRLSHARVSDHTTHPRRALSIEFAEEGERELDPSLRDGVPPRPDLNRYSRDYYVAPATNIRSSSQHFQHQKNQRYQTHHPKQQQQKPWQQHQQEKQQPHRSPLLSSSTEHQITFRASPDPATNDQEQIQTIGGGLQDTSESINETPLHNLRSTELESYHHSNWKKELRNIQDACVGREVAKFQRTINETQRRWEENYARHIPRSTYFNGQSDSSTEVLHNSHVDAYLVPPRHDLWRTVSEDTITAQPKEKTVIQPLLRHTSVDNLKPSAKVSNLHNLGSLPQQNMSIKSVSSMSNIIVNSTTSLGKSTSYQHNSHYKRSVESISACSDGESHGEGVDSDASTHTQDEVPMLPSVRKLASKFDLANQERVNDLDKHGKDNIHLIEKVSTADQPYTRSLTNNLNKRTEKPYIVKEVRSLPDDWESRHNPETGICNSDVDNSEFDDHTTDTSLSLPATPDLLSGKYSFSTSSLLDTDSSYSVDCRDSNNSTSYDQLNDKTIFGVTLRKTRQSSTVSIGSRKRTSVSSISTLETTPIEQVNHGSRCPSNTTIHDQEITPSDSDSDATSALHQSTFIKIQHGSISDLSDQDSELEYQKMFHNLDLHLTSDVSKINASIPCLQANKTQGIIKQPATRIPTLNRQSSMSNISLLSGPAFAPTGRRRMSDFLNNYRGQKSLPEINQKDEKFCSDLSSQRTSDAYKLQNYSFQSQLKESPKRDTFKKSESERSFRAVHCNKESPKKSPFRKAVSERSFRSINCNECQSLELKNIGSCRGSEMKEETKSVTAINDTSAKLPVSNKEGGLTKTENILQSSRLNLATISTALSCEESLNQIRYGKSDSATNHALLQIPVTNVSDDVDNFSQESEMPCTAIQNEEGDLCGIDLNKTYVAAFQAKVKENFQTPTESEVNMLTGQNPNVTISKNSGDKAVKGTTNMHPLRRHKSIGDLLKEYTNINSLDQKPVFSNVKPYENVTKTESNKTIIAISNSEMHPLPKAQNGTSKETVEKEKMHPSRIVGSNVKIPPVSKEDAVKDTYYSDRRTTKEVEDTLQMVDCISVDSKYQGNTNTSTIISLSDDTAISFGTSAMHRASVVYIGDNIKEGDNYFSEVNVYDKTSPVTRGPSENNQAVNIHDELLHLPKDTFNNVSPNGLKTEYECALQSLQSGSTGGESLNGNITSDPSQDDIQINHAHTNTKAYVNDIHRTIKTDEVDKSRTIGPHITVISVSETSDSPLPSHKHDFKSHLSDSSDDDLLVNDPVAMTRMIVHSSRTGNSNQKRMKRHNLMKASIPVNSPFSPLKSYSSILKASCKPYTEGDPLKKKVGPRDSYDEGVDLQMSDMETIPSPTSVESKSTSSLDIIGKEVCEPMV